MAKKKTVPLNSEEALAHLSAGLGGIPMRYGNGPSVTAVPDRGSDPKRKIDMTKPCNDCGMIHVDPNFDYETHSKQIQLGKTIGNALFKGN